MHVHIDLSMYTPLPRQNDWFFFFIFVLCLAFLSLPLYDHLATHQNPMTPAHFRIQGWDPLLIVFQIVAFQSFHYLALSLILPPLLVCFANPTALDIEGGAANVAMVMDWRELLSGGSFGLEPDSTRVYVVASSWVAASVIDIAFLYYIIRKPASILDFSLTLLLNHIVLTTYYAAAFPSSIFWWIIVSVSCIIQIVLAEQLCIRRELQTSFDFDPSSSNTFGSFVFPWSSSEIDSRSPYHQLSPQADDNYNKDSIPLTERQSPSTLHNNNYSHDNNVASSSSS